MHDYLHTVHVAVVISSLINTDVDDWEIKGWAHILSASVNTKIFRLVFQPRSTLNFYTVRICVSAH